MSGASAAIILAAGFSRRMGRLKPLLPLGDATLADHVISIFRQNNLNGYLVVGYRQEEVRAGIRTSEVTVIENPDYERGMFTSVQAGVRALAAGCERFFISPVDVPLVSPATVARLLAEAGKHPEAVIRPVFDGRRGHPVLIPARLIPAILRWDRPGGLAALLAEDNNGFELAVSDANTLFDVDSPADYEELLRRFKRDEMPDKGENMQKSLVEQLKASAPGGRIACAAAWEFARKHRVSRKTVGEAADEMEMRIVDCPLGCFGASKATHGELAGKQPQEPVRSEVMASLIEGYLPCVVAHGLARRLGVTPREVGDTATLLSVRISRCQLGCF